MKNKVENMLQESLTGGIVMKGYVVTTGYMGYVNGEYMLFASEEDYQTYLDE